MPVLLGPPRPAGTLHVSWGAGLPHPPTHSRCTLVQKVVSEEDWTRRCSPVISSWLTITSCRHVAGLNNLLAAYEDKTAWAQCTFAFCAGVGEDVELFSGKTKVSHGSLRPPLMCLPEFVTCELLMNSLPKTSVTSSHPRARLCKLEGRSSSAGTPFSSLTVMT